MLLNCGVREDSRVLGLQEDQTKSKLSILKHIAWIFIGRIDAEAEAPILWPPDEKNWFIGKDWCWERLKAGGEGDNRRWDSWMASPTQWTWVWVDSWSWWWIVRPSVLWFMGLQRVGHDWVTELNWLRYIHVAAYGIISFLLMAEQYFIVCMHHIFFIHSSVDGHLGCFHVLAIVILLQWTLGCMYVFELWFSLDIWPGMGLLDHTIALFLF